MRGSTYTVTVPADKAGGRLDRLLADSLPELSRSRLKAMIEEGRVLAAGVRAATDPARRVSAGESFVVDVPAPPSPTPLPQAMDLSIVYEDDHLVVVDKPAGLVVHPGAGNPQSTLVNALLAHCPAGLSSIGAPLRPGIVHRLDKDTSGLLVVAKTDAAHRELARQFAGHTVERAYHAVVWGNPLPAAGRISNAIGRCRADRRKMAVVSRGGKAAVTTYRTLLTFGSVASLLECRLETGRTHQIRVHMAAAGHPLMGDPAYGRSRAPSADHFSPRAAERMGRQALHAFLIGFKHPEGGRWLRFVSRFPNDLNALIESLESV